MFIIQGAIVVSMLLTIAYLYFVIFAVMLGWVCNQEEAVDRFFAVIERRTLPGKHEGHSGPRTPPLRGAA